MTPHSPRATSSPSSSPTAQRRYVSAPRARVEFEANSTLQRFGGKAFMRCLIVALTLHERTKSIETRVFLHCAKLV
jgi:hypothetical protein